MEIQRWAIRQISTQHYIPLTLKNHSASEPLPDCVPRLFDSKISAQAALNRWLEGVWHLSYIRHGYYGEDVDVELSPENPPNPRDKADMEVVKVRIEINVVG
jgi:hypothetical protein